MVPPLSFVETGASPHEPIQCRLCSRSRVTRDSLFASAAEISHDLSLHAADLDRDGRPPIGEIVKLKKAGLLNALHAREIGGGGLDWVDGLKLVRILARGESSIGQLLGYHYVNSQSIYWSFADQARAQVLGAETVSQNLYWELRSTHAIPA